MAGSYKKAPPPVPTHEVRPKFPHVRPLRLPLLKTRIYAKNATVQDPSQFTNSGYDDSGSPPLTGQFGAPK